MYFSRIKALELSLLLMHIDADKSPFITNTHTKSIQKQIVEYDIKSKYPGEHSTTN